MPIRNMHEAAYVSAYRSFCFGFVFSLLAVIFFAPWLSLVFLYEGRPVISVLEYWLFSLAFSCLVAALVHLFSSYSKISEHEGEDGFTAEIMVETLRARGAWLVVLMAWWHGICISWNR